PQQVADRFDWPSEHRRVARAVADEDAARTGLEDRLCVPVARDDHDLEPTSGETRGDRALRAEVEHGDARTRPEAVRLLGPDLAAERTAVDRRLGECARVELFHRRFAECAAKHAAIANRPDEYAGVDVLERYDSLRFEPARPCRTCLAHDDRLRAHAG